MAAPCLLLTHAKILPTRRFRLHQPEIRPRRQSCGGEFMPDMTLAID